MLHEVEPVTSGERLVAITFIQSRIADNFRRETLYELNEVAALEGLSMEPENYHPPPARPGQSAPPLGRQALAPSPSLRGAQRRGNPPPGWIASLRSQ